MTQIVHVLWSPQAGPICAYENAQVAWEHANAMLGVEVASVEVRTEPPDFVRRADAHSSLDDATTTIAIDDIADAPDESEILIEIDVPDEW